MNFSKAASALLLIASITAACARTVEEPAPKITRPEYVTVSDSIVHFALHQALWGIELWDQGRNQQLYGHNYMKHFVPASNTKLVVTAVAMGLLGPDWRYETPILVSGAPGDSAPRALIIRGTGDPTWSARY